MQHNPDSLSQEKQCKARNILYDNIRRQENKIVLKYRNSNLWITQQVDKVTNYLKDWIIEIVSL